MKPVDEVTDVDVKINDRIGINLYSHSGVAELAITGSELTGKPGFERQQTSVTHVEIDEDALMSMMKAFSDLKSEHYSESFVDEVKWRLDHDKI